MKKIILLGLLAAAAAFTLSSCDAILESLYPEDTVGTGTGNNAVSFTVWGEDNAVGVWANSSGGYASLYATHSVYVKLYDSQGNVMGTQSANFTDISGGPIERSTPYITFTGLPDGHYHFEAWYDLDMDGTPNYESNYYDGWYHVTYDDYYSTDIDLSGSTTGYVNTTLWEY